MVFGLRQHFLEGSAGNHVIPGNWGLLFSVTMYGTQSGRLSSFDNHEEASMDRWSVLRMAGFGLCLGVAVLDPEAFIASMAVRAALASLGASGLGAEERIFYGRAAVPTREVIERAGRKVASSAARGCMSLKISI